MDKKTPETKKKAPPKKPAAFIIIDNTNMVGWLMSCFIVCGCMFFLGVLVGRNTAPVQFDVDRIEEKLSNLQVSVLQQKEAESAEPETMSIPTTIRDVAELAVIHEDIIDKLKDKGREPEIYEQYVPPVFTPKYPKTPPSSQTPARAEKSSAPETEKQISSSASTGRPEPVAVLTPEIRSTAQDVDAPVVTPKSKNATKSLQKTKQDIPEIRKTGTESHGFAIQVASLKDPEKAKTLMNKFRQKGYPAFCESSEVNGATWHRVRIGPYPERSLADKDQVRLKSAGVESLIISINKNNI